MKPADISRGANLKAKFDELESNSKIKNIRDLYKGISDFKRGYQTGSNVMKDEKGDLVADSRNILNRWRNYFSQLLNVRGINDVNRTATHTVEQLVHEPIAFDVELAIENLKGHKSPGIDQILAELIKAGGRTFRYEIHKLIISIWNKEELPEDWKESVIVPIYKWGDKTDCTNYRAVSLSPTTHNILSNILLSRLTPYAEEIIGNHQSGFRRNRPFTDHIFCICQILDNKSANNNKAIYRLKETLWLI